ncbi:MAG TPA: RNA-binding S4 domain-containing protein [Solirubrobacteraceae bacterium]|nr:RNA-binding S4 domain-containing protein [Solirubrobacteraceae bacterium]
MSRPEPQAPEPAEVEIRGAMIRLGQLLKLAGIVDSGAAAKRLLERETVAVNGEAERRRGRQLHDGDQVEVGGRELRVRAAGAE